MKTIITSGRRKQSIARAMLTEGNGRVRINKLDLDAYEPELARLKIMEPLILAGEISSKIDIDVDVNGGGFITQADAARLSIARALVQYSPKLRDTYLNYDRHMIVADIRVKESAKPNHHGQARARTQTSYR